MEEVNRSKHMVARRGFIEQHVQLGDNIYQHRPDVMPAADMQTNPLDGPRLEKLISLIDTFE